MKNNLGKRVVSGSIILSSVLSMGVCSVPMVDAKEAPTLEYSSHVQDYGWLNPVTSGITGTTGEAKRMEAFKLAIKNIDGVSLSFDAHIQDYGWVTGFAEDDIVGTTGEAKRIEALVVRADGLLEKGYKLQYRVHAQDYGWMAWTDEGFVAGTTGEAKRIEAIEFRLVEVETPLSAIVEEYKNEIEAYTLALVDAAEKADKELTDAPFASVSKKIDKAMADLDKAETEKEATEIYHDIVAEIGKETIGTTAPGDLQEAIKDITEKANEEKAIVNEKIAIYRDVLADADMSNTAKTNIEKTIKKAEDAIAIAKTAEQVDNAYESMSGVIDNYMDYDLEVNKKIAIAELEKYAADSETDVQELIEKAIEEISEKETTDEVKKHVADVKGISEKQQKALDLIDKCADAMDYVEGLTTANKALLQTSLDGARDAIINAKKLNTIDNDIKNAINKLKTDVAKDSPNYGKLVELQIYIEKTIDGVDANANDAEKFGVLTKYLNSEYEDVKSLAQLYKSYYENCISLVDETKVKKAVADITNAITEYDNPETVDKAGEVIYADESVVTVGNSEYLITNLVRLVESLELDETNAANEARSYKTTYDNAMAAITNYEEQIAIMDATQEQKDELLNMVANTKAAIRNSKNTSEIRSAKGLLDEYVNEYYSELAKEAGEFMFETTKTSAIDELSSYKDSKVAGVSTAANIAISKIEDMKYPTKDVSDITTELNNAKENIELLTTQSEAFATLDAYKYSDTIKVEDNDGNPANNDKTIIEIKEMIETIVAKTESETYTVQQKLDEIEKIMEAAIPALDKAVELENAIFDATKFIKEYLGEEYKNSKVLYEGVEKTVPEVADIFYGKIVGIKTDVSVEDKVGEVTIELNNFKDIIKSVNEKNAEKLTNDKEEENKIIDEYISMAKVIKGDTGKYLENRFNAYKLLVGEADNSEELTAAINRVNAEVQANEVLNAKDAKLKSFRTTYIDNAEIASIEGIGSLEEDEKFNLMEITEYSTSVKETIDSIIAEPTLVVATLNSNIDTIINRHKSVYDDIIAYKKAAINTKNYIEGLDEAGKYSYLVKDFINEVSGVDYSTYKATKSEDGKTEFDKIKKEADEKIPKTNDEGNV